MLRVFPVAGPTHVPNSFGEPRGERRHDGNDLFATENTPLVAVDDGEVRFGRDPLGGNIANLYTADNTRYYYAHLSGFEGVPRIVRVGEVIGYLGRTGNAAATPPHLHFSVHPNRGAAVDPFPMLMAAPRVDLQSPAAPRSPLRTVAILAIAGLGTWAILNPAAADRAVRRLRLGLANAVR